MCNKAGVIVYDNLKRKLLTISNQFDANIGLPKGNVEEHETDYEAAFRELYEETGLKFDDNNKPKIVAEYYNRSVGDGCLFYVIHLPNGSLNNNLFKPQESENIYNVKWRTFADLKSNILVLNLTIRTSKNIIRDYIKYLFK